MITAQELMDEKIQQSRMQSETYEKVKRLVTDTFRQNFTATVHISIDELENGEPYRINNNLTDFGYMYITFDRQYVNDLARLASDFRQNGYFVKFDSSVVIKVW